MFNRLIGNNQIKDIFRQMIAKSRVPRSLLFAGEDGIGKKSFALELAKTFVCQTPVESEACGECFACYRADNFKFPKPDDKKEEFERVIFSEHSDIGMIIPCRNNILVKAIRDLEKESNFRPFEAKGRFFIIDDADKMNKESANALLKTLEEPTTTSHIFLISSRPDSLLHTILSRCQIIRFAPLETKEIESYLVDKQQFTPENAAFSAQVSRGSISRAQGIDPEKIREIRSQVLQILDSILLKNDRASLLKTSEELNDAKNKENYEKFIEILQDVVHDVWSLRLGKDEVNNSDIKNLLANLAEKADSKIFGSWLEEIEALRQNFAVNINRKIATDALFIQMAG